MPDRTGMFFWWSVNLSNFLGFGVEAGASPMYPQKMRVHPLGYMPRFVATGSAVPEKKLFPFMGMVAILAM